MFTSRLEVLTPSGNIKSVSWRATVLLLALLLSFLSPVGAVTCPTCKDTIPGCAGGSTCPLLKAPLDNARLLSDTTSTKAPDLTSLLPRAMLCTFSKAVVESIVAVAKAPKGGGSSDISTAAIAKPAGVVKAALNGACSWEDAGLELAGRMEDATTDSAIAAVNQALGLLKAMSDKTGGMAQSAVESGVGLFTFIWGKIGVHRDAIKKGTVKLLARTQG